MFLTIYIFGVLCSVFVCFVAVYLNYREGINFTLHDLSIVLLVSTLSWIGAILTITVIINEYGDNIVLIKGKDCG